jgi:hydrogenase/urease accessory protein HupE
MRIALAFFIFLFASTAYAHGMRTAYLEITETRTGEATATLRFNAMDPGVVPRFGPHCTTKRIDTEETSHIALYSVACASGLVGAELALEGLGPVVTEAVVRVTLHDDRKVSHILTRERPEFVIPREPSRIRVAMQYARLGVIHILTGADHLLFLVCLVLLARRFRELFWTETAFTIAHTVSFGAVALGVLQVNPAAAEACIALSLVLLARDVLATERRQNQASLAFVFGTVHGLGFAGGLTEIGIPESDAATALVSFGAGVEIGQVVFLAIAWIVIRWLQRKALVTTRLTAYGVGVLGSAWMFERLWICFW